MQRIVDFVFSRFAIDGGPACEYFFHILANPGDEISFWMAGKVLSDPLTPWETPLKSCLEELYGPTTPAACEGLDHQYRSAIARF